MDESLDRSEFEAHYALVFLEGIEAYRKYGDLDFMMSYTPLQGYPMSGVVDTICKNKQRLGERVDRLKVVNQLQYHSRKGWSIVEQAGRGAYTVRMCNVTEWLLKNARMLREEGTDGEER